MSYVIVYQGLAGKARRAGRVPIGSYLKSYDLEAHDGQGTADWTTDPTQALLFESLEAAAATWKQVPKARRYRPDGKLNRPLTAFNVLIEEQKVP